MNNKKAYLTLIFSLLIAFQPTNALSWPKFSNYSCKNLTAIATVAGLGALTYWGIQKYQALQKDKAFQQKEDAFQKKKMLSKNIVIILPMAHNLEMKLHYKRWRIISK